MRLEQDPTVAARLAEAFRSVRGQTERLCEPLAAEDYVVQSMPDASPAKWHLAHTSWFFETFVLAAAGNYRPFDPAYGFLFNSYYNAVGDRLPRPRRGLLSRPPVEEVYRYRGHVDRHVLDLLCDDMPLSPALATVVELGLNHEQQHQELMLTDLKHVFGCNPLRPAYRQVSPPSPPLRGRGVGGEGEWPPNALPLTPDPSPLSTGERGGREPRPPGWTQYPAGVRWIGHAGRGFAFDNESPRHRVFVDAFLLADRLATCGEYLAFMEAGGYDRPDGWLSDGWQARTTHDWTAPLYWEKIDGDWAQFTLDGVRPVRDDEPVCHLSYYEADAFARWSGARLPTEAEWEAAADDCPLVGSFLEGGRLHPALAPSASGSPAQMFGEAWQWTASPYVAYPGYRPLDGALGEYNGKFMCNQLVLRGGSCATPRSHFRRCYRNFFSPDARWQFAGVRLARDP